MQRQQLIDSIRDDLTKSLAITMTVDAASLYFIDKERDYKQLGIKVGKSACRSVVDHITTDVTLYFLENSLQEPTYGKKLAANVTANVVGFTVGEAVKFAFGDLEPQKLPKSFAIRLLTSSLIFAASNYEATIDEIAKVYPPVLKLKGKK